MWESDHLKQHFSTSSTVVARGTKLLRLRNVSGKNTPLDNLAPAISTNVSIGACKCLFSLQSHLHPCFAFQGWSSMGCFRLSGETKKCSSSVLLLQLAVWTVYTSYSLNYAEFNLSPGLFMLLDIVTQKACGIINVLQDPCITVYESGQLYTLAVSLQLFSSNYASFST